jgi:hypothetical protein
MDGDISIEKGGVLRAFCAQGMAKKKVTFGFALKEERGQVT